MPSSTPSAKSSGERSLQRIVRRDPLLGPFADVIRRRQLLIDPTEKRLTGGRLSLADFASGHEYFGLDLKGNQWVLREWAPNASRIFLISDGTGWKEKAPCELKRKGADGVWELRLPKKTLRHGDPYRLKIHWRGGRGDRIPAWARRVVQDPATLIFNAQVWRPETTYRWRHPRFRRRSWRARPLCNAAVPPSNREYGFG